MDNQSVAYIALSLGGILFLWNIVITGLLLKQRQFFSNFTKGISKKDLHTVLKNIASSLKTVGEEIDALHKKHHSLESEGHSHFQKIGFIRFNPFSDTGGDQSFCLCLLDQDNSGIVITSLHSREQTRIYGKQIRNGKAEAGELSREETEALSSAMKETKKRQ